jgi:undecaprenyl diphosphate synthase
MADSTVSKPTQKRHPIFDIPMERMPGHVAIIMDGNGRWARERGLPRVEGHRNGSRGVRTIINESARLGFECLTLYSFSLENWKRPREEVSALMELYRHYLIHERPTIMNNNVQVRHIGQEEGLPDSVLEALHETIELSRENTGMTLLLALNYSGRSEIVQTVRTIVGEVQKGALAVEDIDEETISSNLDTHGLPDPDLLIRTSGEMRISNFLLWQISYAELYVTDVHWPDFNEEILAQAIRAYASRNRRFGGVEC